MHITLHLTTGCNLNCTYCYAPPFHRADMALETAHKAVEYAGMLSPFNAGVIFFGGEPLLRKDLIKSTISYCHKLKKKFNYQFHFKVTTNGMLLDEEFLDYCQKVKLSVALSIDGIKEAHNFHRKTSQGEGTFNIIEPKINLLLKYKPYAYFLMVITPETVKHYYNSVKYLFDKGAKYIIASINYAGNWREADLNELKRQYRLLSNLYKEMTIKQKKFYFSPFEMKFSSYIKNEDGMCEKCPLGMKQVSIAADGTIYPCVQFINKEGYEIGNVYEGINFKKREKLYNLTFENTACSGCKVLERCNNRCSCLNYQTTGHINNVSPVLCETERMLIPVVDRLGEKLFSGREPMFIQKHYNAVYPLLSLLEDMNS